MWDLRRSGTYRALTRDEYGRLIMVLVVLCAPLIRCADSPFGPESTFRGHYAYGFEQNDFYRCGADFSQRWWVTGDLSAVHAFIAAQHPAQPRVYVRWMGRLSREGAEGLERQIRVTEILEVRESQASDCD